MKTLVRFSRSHADDDELFFEPFEREFGFSTRVTTPDQYFQQLVVELREGNFNLPLTLVKFEGRTEDPDTYRMYVLIDDTTHTTELVPTIQLAYDEGGAAGWFEVIMEIVE